MTGVELACGVVMTTAPRSPGARSIAPETDSDDAGLPAASSRLADALRLAVERHLTADPSVVTPEVAVEVAVTPLGATLDLVAAPLTPSDVAAIEADVRATVPGADVSLAAGPWRREGDARQRLRAALPRAAATPAPRASEALVLRAGEVLALLAGAAGWTRSPDGSLVFTSCAGEDELLRAADRLACALVRALGGAGPRPLEVAIEGGAEGAAARLATALPDPAELGPPGEGPLVVTWRLRDALGRSCRLGRLELQPASSARLDLGEAEDVAALALAIGAGRAPLLLAPEAVAVLPVGPGEEASARALVADLALAGVPATLATATEDGGPLGPRVAAAAARRVPLVAVLGPAELSAGTVALRPRADLASLWPTALARAELPARVAAARDPLDTSPREASGRPAHLRRPDGRDGDLNNPVWRN